jgi:hypothetical protein
MPVVHAQVDAVGVAAITTDAARAGAVRRVATSGVRSVDMLLDRASSEHHRRRKIVMALMVVAVLT